MSVNLSKKQEERLQKAINATKTKHKLFVDAYYINPNLCLYCSQVIPFDKRRNKFCRKSCSCSFNNKIRDTSSYSKYNKKPCLVCGTFTRNIKYCNNKCQVVGMKQQRFKEITISGSVEGRHPDTIKKYLFDTRGKKCDICGITEWNGKNVPLVLDHINGKPQDNNLNNLRLVCGNCNMQLPTFAGRNVGKGGGRPYRNKRYLEGKSY